MATVRISGNWKNASKMEWGGAPEVDASGHIDRSIATIPAAAYDLIEKDLARGSVEGTVYLPDGARVNWFLDR